MWKKKQDKPITTAQTTTPSLEPSATKMTTTTTTTTATSRRFFQHRSKSPLPAPIDTSVAGTTTTTTSSSSSKANNSDTTSSSTSTPFTYLHSGHRTSSPPPLVASPTSLYSPATTTTPTPTRAMHKRHSNPYGHTKRKSSGGGSLSDNRRLSGTVNHRGRHANDWLFGGFSVRESVGKLWNGANEGEGGRGGSV
ncbi:hypothetical protein EMCG_02790 [[Emmonsia] crescens]|uniref:Uncharacterized protein n=1 Tax=[Emmonsia] crescens TaxID=73230 RepID=A0A0G2J8U8_9EURO|nr:hypothetical protein EMCG_02790 [Emmonsia crescens UAMH 3008]